MTIDEAIKGAEDAMIRSLKLTEGRKSGDPVAAAHAENADYNRQLIEWLKDYKRLLSVETSEDCISRKAAVDLIMHDIVDKGYGNPVAITVANKIDHSLPSVEPTRAKGRWTSTNAYPHWVICDKCHKKFIPNQEWIELYGIPINYCPNCGAEMEISDADS